jgi:hypothetical protein
VRVDPTVDNLNCCFVFPRPVKMYKLFGQAGVGLGSAAGLLKLKNYARTRLSNRNYLSFPDPLVLTAKGFKSPHNKYKPVVNGKNNPLSSV